MFYIKHLYLNGRKMRKVRLADSGRTAEDVRFDASASDLSVVLELWFFTALPWIYHEFAMSWWPFMTLRDQPADLCRVRSRLKVTGTEPSTESAWSKAICARSFCAEATNAGFHHLSEELFYANIQRLKHETRYIMYIIYIYIHTYIYIVDYCYYCCCSYS